MAITSPPSTGSPHRAVRSWFKRGMDLTVAASALVVLSPLLLTAAIAVRLGLGSPVLFIQERPGLDGRPFRLRKFRTMRDALDADGRPLPDAERLTRLGRFLRASSIDELPELLNVLAGHMSLVGPRPWLMEYLPHYTPQQRRRHDVLPGITGWAQVHGRNAASWEDRLQLDVWYVDHWNPWLDLRILCRTAWTVVRREGISAQGHATMPRFDSHPSPRPLVRPAGGPADASLAALTGDGSGLPASPAALPAGSAGETGKTPAV
jgi:lipopolysaccharide/colanic/teichoic acid biosynthesis glycosyltransferase